MRRRIKLAQANDYFFDVFFRRSDCVVESNRRSRGFAVVKHGAEIGLQKVVAQNGNVDDVRRFYEAARNGGVCVFTVDKIKQLIGFMPGYGAVVIVIIVYLSDDAGIAHAVFFFDGRRPRNGFADRVAQIHYRQLVPVVVAGGKSRQTGKAGCRYKYCGDDFFAHNCSSSARIFLHSVYNTANKNSTYFQQLSKKAIIP